MPDMGKDKRGSRRDNRTCPDSEVRKGLAPFSEGLVSVPGAQRGQSGVEENSNCIKDLNTKYSDVIPPHRLVVTSVSLLFLFDSSFLHSASQTKVTVGTG